MSEEILLIEEKDGICLITLNRPDSRNALSTPLREKLVQALDKIATDDGIGAVVLTGAGSTFCAGFDLKEFASGNMDEILAQANIYHHKVFTFSKPIVAAIIGPAVAGGMDLALMCDVRICSEETVFGQPQVRMGIPAAFDLMRTVISDSAARELCLSGRRINSAEALSMGLVSFVVSADLVLEQAETLARQIKENKNGPVMKGLFLKNQPKLFV